MPITEIPNSSSIYRVQPTDKDQASQKNEYQRREKKKNEDKKGKKQEDLSEKGAAKSKDANKRINLIA